MNRKACPNLLLSALLCASVPAASFGTLTLKNGLPVALFPSPRTPAVTLHIRFKRGAAEELLNRGGAQAILATVARRIVELDHRGLLHVATRLENDAVIWSVSGLEPVLREQITSIAATLSNPPSPEEMVLSPSQEERDDGELMHAYRVAVSRAYEGHPLASWQPTFSQVSKEELSEFYAHAAGSKRLTLAVSGGFDETKWLPLLEASFGQLPTGTAPKPPPPFELPRSLDIVEFTSTSAGWLVLLFPFEISPDLHLFARHFFAGELQERLEATVVERLGLAHRVEVLVLSKGVVSELVVMAVSAPSLLMEARDAILWEIARTKYDLTAEEMSRASRRLRGALHLGEERIFLSGGPSPRIPSAEEWAAIFRKAIGHYVSVGLVPPHALEIEEEEP